MRSDENMAPANFILNEVRLTSDSGLIGCKGRQSKLRFTSPNSRQRSPGRQSPGRNRGVASPSSASTSTPSTTSTSTLSSASGPPATPRHETRPLENRRDKRGAQSAQDTTALVTPRTTPLVTPRGSPRQTRGSADVSAFISPRASPRRLLGERQAHRRNDHCASPFDAARALKERARRSFNLPEQEARCADRGDVPTWRGGATSTCTDRDAPRTATNADSSQGSAPSDVATPPPPKTPTQIRNFKWSSREDTGTGSICEKLVDANLARRLEEIAQEVKRIEVLDRRTFPSLVDWGFAVLGISHQRDIASVRRAHRLVMKKLHPDKAEQSPAVAQALERFLEAKRVCERSLLQQEPPPMPRILRVQALCSTLGKRRFHVEWADPEGPQQAAPVEKYVVAVQDISTGRVLRIRDLEPDYNAELGRFVSIEDLRQFELAEAELTSIHSFFKEASITVCVAAANKAGQSGWAATRIPLYTAPAVPAAAVVHASITGKVFARPRPATVLRQRN